MNPFLSVLNSSNILSLFSVFCVSMIICSNSKVMYETHLSREVHKSGKRAVRCDKREFPEKCPKCNYIPKNFITFTRHNLIHHTSKEDRKKAYKYFCETCDFGTPSEKLFNNHKATSKHILLNP